MDTITRQYGDYTASVCRDDNGRYVAEVWHTATGKEVGIEDAGEFEAAWWTAKRMIDNAMKETAR